MPRLWRSIASTHKSASVQLAILSYAISLWIDGTTQMRDILGEGVGMEELFGEGLLITSNSIRVSNRLRAPGENFSTRRRVLDWLVRRGRALDAGERAALAIVQISSSLMIFRLVGLSPLFPFLFSPFLSAVVLPFSLHSRRLRWTHVITSSIFFAFLHEIKRFIVVQVVGIYKRRHAGQESWLGKVTAVGLPVEQLRRVESNRLALPRNLEDYDVPDDQECLICSGVGIDGPASQPLSGGASTIAALGPLEVFCVNAPALHLMHRPCLLRWQEEYQRGRTPQAIILRLQSDNTTDEVPNENHLRRSRCILQRAGLGFLAPEVRFIDSYEVLPLSSPSILTITTSSLDTKSNDNPSPVATLQTSYPPCPGCRSPILLHFIAENPNRSARMAKPSGWIHRLCLNMLATKRDWSNLVTGRTILRKTVAQISFILALVGMVQSQSTQRRMLAPRGAD